MGYVVSLISIVLVYIFALIFIEWAEEKWVEKEK